MRPRSIVMFERLFLASIALGAASFALSYRQLADVVANDPGAQQLGLGNGFLVGAAIVSNAVYLLLWYLIARRALNFAKWVLLVFTVIGVLIASPALAGPWGASLVLSVVVYALAILALVYLFRPDAKAWLDRTGRVDPAAFD